MNNQEFGSALVAATIPRGVLEEATERAMFCAQQFIDAAEKPASVKQAFAWELRDAAASLRSALESADARVKEGQAAQPDSVTAALQEVLSAVRDYLPPDGIDAKRAMSRVIAAVDPWPCNLPVNDGQAATRATVEAPLSAEPAASLAMPGLSGLVFAVAYGDKRDVRMLFDTSEQAHTFVEWLKPFMSNTDSFVMLAAAPPTAPQGEPK